MVNNLLGPTQAKYSNNNLAKTILARLIIPIHAPIPSEKLIKETAISSEVLKAEETLHSYNNLDLLNKKSTAWFKENNRANLPIFNADNNLIFKPIIISNTASSSENYGSPTIAQRSTIINYTVRNGDTISAIARRFGLSINTILWANDLKAYSLIRPGDKLTILPTSGILYTAQSGDTISGLASRYGVKAKQILAANDLSAGLKIKQKIIIPGGRPISRYRAIARPIRTNNRYTSGISAIRNLIKSPINQVSRSGLVWPTVGHTITQYFSWHHHAIDIANRIGTPIYAAAAGRVLIAQGGWNGGYGNTILLDNGNHMETRYAHASKLLVRPGQWVKRGQIIALMGSTGNSTGPHVHFEVIINGIRRNPLNYVR